MDLKALFTFHSTAFGPSIKSPHDFVTASYDTIIVANSSDVDKFFSLFMHPVVPFVAVVVYLLLSDLIFKAVKNIFGIEPKSPILKAITICHSSILAIYSGWTFLGASQIIIPQLTQNGLYPTLCDSKGVIWEKAGLGFWITHFYLSKFYEFIDTWIILLKGGKPIFLQTFHHAGIVVFMWGFVVTHNTSGGLITTWFNSFIHTLMYTYYVFAAFGYRSPLKNYLTQAQIVQFIIGIALTFPPHFMPGCITQAQSLVNAGIQLYAVILIYLFYMFYVSNYAKKDKEDKKEKDDKKEK